MFVSGEGGNECPISQNMPVSFVLCHPSVRVFWFSALIIRFRRKLVFKHKYALYLNSSTMSTFHLNSSRIPICTCIQVLLHYFTWIQGETYWHAIQFRKVWGLVLRPSTSSSSPSSMIPGIAFTLSDYHDYGAVSEKHII